MEIAFAGRMWMGINVRPRAGLYCEGSINQLRVSTAQFVTLMFTDRQQLSTQTERIIYIFIHRNGTEKYNNTKTIKSERKIEANNVITCSV